METAIRDARWNRPAYRQHFESKINWTGERLHTPVCVTVKKMEDASAIRAQNWKQRAPEDSFIPSFSLCGKAIFFNGNKKKISRHENKKHKTAAV